MDTTTLTIRRALPEEYEALGALTAQAYLDGGHLDFGEDDPYLAVLRDVPGRAAHAEILVAEVAGKVLGGVTYVPSGGPMADIAGANDAEIRMLAVSAEARGRGAGEALVRECVRRAKEAGRTSLVLSTQRSMHAAHRLYERLGFVRTPERDWRPIETVPLLAYALKL
ncbi:MULTISPECIES: GNAT family N-acetyltransferase [Streptomyces]|uniref:GNAT family N-acetyltransferase n=1 Tax=Streptomyces TaxID=1883 RepID=UPI001E627FB9|nr:MULTISPECIES: GNAT family N-acetyltransferase [Streptomyces]UFQ17956.1 GNAT family N-acetyltransferase [Streptomyces huasconensis]WCL87564.1 GNAT family N-acetyltransferase [Streptomyces sp. JCM 35825]